MIATSDTLIAVCEPLAVAWYSRKNLHKLRVERIIDEDVIGIFPLLNNADSIEQRFVLITSLGNVIEVCAAPTSTAVQRRWKIACENDEDFTLRQITFWKDAVRGEGHIVFTSSKQVQSVIIPLHAATEEDVSGGGKSGKLEVTKFPPFFPARKSPASSLFLNCGLWNGNTAVCFKGDNAVEVYRGRDSAARPSNLEIPFAIETVAVQPLEQQQSIAIGGSRGELAVFVVGGNGSFFSDHWHHTPLVAMCFSLDGSTLFTGAGEGVVLCWSMTDFSSLRITATATLGAIRFMQRMETTSTTVGETLLLTCADSTLAVVDTGTKSLLRQIQGVQMLNAEQRSATGMVCCSWRGRSCVALLGYRDMISFCDPIKGEAFHSIFVPHSMETAAPPKTVGIKFAGILDEGNTVVAYDAYEGIAIPPRLIFFKFDSAQGAHLPAQIIHNPHPSPIRRLLADSRRRIIVTLSHECVKVWCQQPNSESQMMWIPTTLMMQSRSVHELAISNDASVIFAADSSVWLFAQESSKQNAQWKEVGVLYPSRFVGALSHLECAESNTLLISFSRKWLLQWSLLSDGDLIEHQMPSEINCVCYLSIRRAVLCGLSDGTLRLMSLGPTRTDATVELMTVPTGCPSLRFLCPIGALDLALVDDRFGFRTMNLSSPVEPLHHTTSHSTSTISDSKRNRISAAFPIPDEIPTYGSSTTQESAKSNDAKIWLDTVLRGEAFSSPPIGTVLSQFLDNFGLK